MDALYPRLLVTRFAECLRFYDGLLTGVLGAHLTKGTPDGPYAHWDLGDQGLLSLFERSLMDAVTGAPRLPVDAARPDMVALVLTVEDIEKAALVAVRHGGTVIVPPTFRPEWGPGCRTAHLRDPDGNLVELQSY
ncbi:VOC family protein [Microtetraspora malaysiensis]|uniref:VOC family protein n=1 Tax=Microtetraspora malaysiensis TaxID=161358 RepID=A0ABW6SVL0_9ACTN